MPQTLAELKKIDCARMMEIVLGRLDDIMFRRARAQRAGAVARVGAGFALNAMTVTPSPRSSRNVGHYVVM